MADERPRILFEPGRVRVTGRGVGGIKTGGGGRGGGKGGGKGGGRAVGLADFGQLVAAFGAVASAHSPASAVPPPRGVAFRAIGHAQVSSNNTLLSVLPVGLASGDVMVMCVSLSSNSRTVTTPAGWTQTPASPSALGGALGAERMAVFYRVAGAGETAPTVTVSGVADWQIDILAFTGVNGTTPVEIDALGAWNAVAFSYTFPSVTTTTNGDGILLVSWDDSGSGASSGSTPPAGYATIASPVGVSKFVAILGSKATAGATGTVTVGFGEGTKHVGLTIGLKPA